MKRVSTRASQRDRDAALILQLRSYHLDSGGGVWGVWRCVGCVAVCGVCGVCGECVGCVAVCGAYGIVSCCVAVSHF
jgi:ABC-type ATPase with predicted acetyltransferase domain